MTEWRAIETAPNDGIIKLGFVPSHDNNDYWIGPIWFDADDNTFLSDGVPKDIVGGNDGDELDPTICEKVAPTHWMPLPDPPKSEIR